MTLILGRTQLHNNLQAKNIFGKQRVVFLEKQNISENPVKYVISGLLNLKVNPLVNY